ncbi:hypothetical protein HNR21_004791 [Actinomadura cellulosilytica]|uniref:Uncharacterized protein n=2 Tax=Thermomonospora cellulosilytica TaxID=1411118 RepID=A0A7W3RAP2_9ACTN|nr:hypothetical protein [Thermomonospora cellulosilytica]
MTLLGAGTDADPHILSAAVRIATTPGNLLTQGPDGLTVACEAVQDCVGEALADGLEYDDSANQIRARVSTQAGNSLSIGPDGGLFAPQGGGNPVTTADTDCIQMEGDGSGAPLSASPRLDSAAGNLLSCGPGGLRAAVTTGTCGLTGNGTAAAPLQARTQAWPYAGPVDANAGGVYCDSAGALRSEPRGRYDFVQSQENVTYPSPAVPSGADNVVTTRSLTVTNPDPCRPAAVILEVEADVDFDLPAGAAGAMGITTDEMVFHRNTGSSAISDWHVQVTKMANMMPIPPGGSATFSIDITMGRGAGGATYNRIQTFLRAFVFVL